MSMIKVITDDSYDFGEPVVQQVKVASDGLKGSDLKQFIKRAGHYLVDEFNKLDFHKDEIPVHLIALGSTEYFSPNRNADGFREENCIKCHHTFEKHAYLYREHDNKDPRKSYGIVKRSLYNPQMHRIELIVALNGSKAAAQKNKGLVADREQEKLARDGTFGVSMSTKVPWDECSFCHNRARHRSEYCTEDECGGGGLKHNLGAVLKCGHVVHADNVICDFFDISHVHKPADRTAYVTGRLVKDAHTGIVSGAELAERLNITAPSYLEDDSTTLPATSIFTNKKYTSLISKLAALEQDIYKTAHNLLLSCPSDSTDINFHVAKPEQLLSALSKQQVVLPLTGFIQLAEDDPKQAAAIANKVKQYLPGTFSRLEDKDNWPELAPDAEHYFVTYQQVPLASYRELAAKAAASYSISEQHIRQRIKQASLNEVRTPALQAPRLFTKSAASNLATNYALYQVGFLYNLQDKLDQEAFELACRSVVTSNYI